VPCFPPRPKFLTFRREGHPADWQADGPQVPAYATTDDFTGNPERSLYFEAQFNDEGPRSRH